MSLAARLQAETPTRTSFATWLISLTPEDRKALEDAGRNPAWSNAALARVIVEEGGAVGKDTIAKWRHGLVAR